MKAAPDALVVVPGVKNASLSDIKTGDRVIANIPANNLISPAALVIDIPSQYDSSDSVKINLPSPPWPTSKPIVRSR